MDELWQATFKLEAVHIALSNHVLFPLLALTASTTNADDDGDDDDDGNVYV